MTPVLIFPYSLLLVLLGVLALPASADDLTERLDQVEREIRQLQRGGAADWLTARRNEELRNLVADVLVDADSRTSLQSDAVTGGWKDRFYLADPGGAFRLEVLGRLQVRYVWNHQADDAVDGDRAGFDIRRMFLEFQGHVVDPSWRYRIVTAFSADGVMGINDVSITKDFGNGWSVTAGRFKLPFMREALMSSKRLLAVDRSLIHQAWTLGRSGTVMVEYEHEQWRMSAAVSNGENTTLVPALAEDTEFALTTRGEFLLAGKWGTFNDFTSFRGSDSGVMLGVAVHAERDESGTTFNVGTGLGNDDERRLISWTADLSVEGGGWNLYTAAVGRHTDRDSGDLDEYGFLVQGGVFVTDDLELFARYEWADDDTDADDLSVATVGFNRYFRKHTLKWTSDVGYGFNAVNGSFPSSGAGWRRDGAGEDGQVVVRSQLQLLF